jgi:O-antigen/teichoic acid export membrane protein
MPNPILEELQAWIGRKQADILPEGSLRARFAVGAFWALTGTMIAQGLQLAATIIVARWLGKAEYGAVGIVRSTVGMLGIFVGLGLGLTATKYVAELRVREPARAGRIASLTMMVALVSATAVTAVLVLLSPWLASRTLASPAVSRPLAIGAGLLFFGELNGVQVGILSGLESFGALARVSLWAGLCSFPIIIASTRIWGLNGAISGLVASLGVNCVLTNTLLRRESRRLGVPLSYRGAWEEHAVLWKFSVPAFLSGVVVTPASWACNALLVNRPKGYAEMGLFSAADQWRTAVLFLPGIVSRVVLPILSSHSDESVEEPSRYSSTLEAGYSVGVLVAFPLIAALSFGASLIGHAYGADFAGIRYPMAGVLYAAGIMSIGQPIGLSVQAKGAMWLGFAANFSWGICLLGSFWFMFLGLGAWGLALAYAGSYLVVLSSFNWYYYKAGYFPWSLGIRTYLACLCLLIFAFGPLLLPPTLSVDFSPVALALAIAAAWVFLPSSVRARLVSQRVLRKTAD